MPVQDAFRDRLVVVVAFVVSRVAYYLAGVRFDAEPLWKYFQFVEPDLLRHRLWESLYYLHMQPPGFNLIAGAVLKLFPDRAVPGALHVLFLGLGLTTALCTLELMRMLRVERWVGLVLVVLFLISPGVVLYENLLMYEFISLAQLSLAAVLLYRFLERRTLGRAVAFHLTMLSLMLVRNSFHMPYYLLLTAAMWWWMRAERRLILAAAAFPVVLMLALHLKNWVLFGQFTTSTWLGLNAGTITTAQLNPEELKRLHAAGLVSDMALVGPAENLSAYKKYIHMPAPTGIPVLDMEQGAMGRPNFNNPAYFQVHRSFVNDAKSVLRHYPKAYLRSVVRAWFCYFLPLGDFPFLENNRRFIHGWDRAFNVVFFGQWKEAATRKDLRRIQDEQGTAVLVLYTGTFLMVGLPLLFAFGLWKLWKLPRDPGCDTAMTALLAFLLYNIASLTALSNFLSSFENNRYRLPLDGFFVVLAGMAITHLAARRAGAPASPQTRA